VSRATPNDPQVILSAFPKKEQELLGLFEWRGDCSTIHWPASLALGFSAAGNSSAGWHSSSAGNFSASWGVSDTAGFCSSWSVSVTDTFSTAWNSSGAASFSRAWSGWRGETNCGWGEQSRLWSAEVKGGGKEQIRLQN
jgi:hypothetical protein